MHMKTIKKGGACLIILVAIYAIIYDLPAAFLCELSDYTCIFSALLKFSGLVLALYLASKIL